MILQTSSPETKTEFPGLERNAQRLFAQPYAELPVRFQAAVRKVTKQDAAEEMLEALKAAQEELRLLRMKDTQAVYDPGLRARVSFAIAKAEGKQ